MRHVFLICMVCIIGAGSAWAKPFNLTIDEVKAELTNHPDVHWKATDTGKVVSLGITEREIPFGLREFAVEDITVTPEKEDFLPDGDVPNYLDWRNFNGKNWLTPIRNQAYCGSCVAFSAVGAFEGQLNISRGRAGANLDLSEEFLFANIGSCASGSMPNEALSFMQSNGIPDEACFPYVSGRAGEDQDVSRACADRTERAYTIEYSQSLYTEDGIKRALTIGPLMFTMQVFEDFMYYQSGIYQHVTGESVGGHAIVLVGFDDANNAWIMRNSWGTDWGEQGYFRIKRDDESIFGQTPKALKISSVSAQYRQVKLLQPIHFGAVSAKTMLQVESLADLEFKEILAEVKNLKTPGTPLVIPINVASGRAELDTTKLVDGVFQVAVSGTFKDNTKTVKPWYSMMIVMNKPQPIKVKLEKDFDDQGTIADRVYFKLKTEYQQVPLTDATVIFKKKDGSYQRNVLADNPGKLSTVGWRTPMSPNGEYDVYAVGKVGTLATFESNHLAVTVKNPN